MCFSIVNALLASESDLSDFYACLLLDVKMIEEIEQIRVQFKQCLQSEESDLLHFKEELNDESSKDDQQQKLQNIKRCQRFLSKN